MEKAYLHLQQGACNLVRFASLPHYRRSLLLTLCLMRLAWLPATADRRPTVIADCGEL